MARESPYEENKLGQRYEHAKRVSHADRGGKSILSRGNSMSIYPDVEVCLRDTARSRQGRVRKRVVYVGHEVRKKR